MLLLVGCGGGGSGGKGGADGGAGTGGQGGEAGHTDGAAGHDAAGNDGPADGLTEVGHVGDDGGDASGTGDALADGTGTDAPNVCVTSVDGGNGCTTALAASNGSDFFCGIKDGNVKCWSSAADAPTVTLTAPVVAAAPAGLRSLSISNAVAADQTFCGVDEAHQGTCWNTNGAQSLGTGLRSVTVSSAGMCRLSLDGNLVCDTGVTPPSGGLFLQIAASEDALAARNATGSVFFPNVTFPPGAYQEVTANDGRRVGAVSEEGTLVTFHGTTQMVRAGSYAHVALDNAGRVCTLDTTGEVGCWSIDSSTAAPPFASLPSGPFQQIVGAKASFCALRPTGTTVCWGDQAINVPAGW